MSIAITITSVIVLFCMLTALIGWGVASYMHWLVVQPRRVTDQQPEVPLAVGHW